MVRAGLAAVLHFKKRVLVVAEAADGEEAVALYALHRPDVTLLDVRMPRLDGPAAAARIRASDPAARLLMLSTSEADEDIRRAFEAGASGYILKSASPADLLEAIFAVHRGERWVPAIVARLAAEGNAQRALSGRQLEVLELLAKGLSNKEIATVLGFTPDGTKAHLKSIYAKLGVNDRTEAVVIAIQRGLIRVD